MSRKAVVGAKQGCKAFEMESLFYRLASFLSGLKAAVCFHLKAQLQVSFKTPRALAGIVKKLKREPAQAVRFKMFHTDNLKLCAWHAYPLLTDLRLGSGLSEKYQEWLLSRPG